MIQPVVNAIMTILLARFILNDIPHALGIDILLKQGNPHEPGWEELLEYAESRNVPLKAMYWEDSTMLSEKTLRNVRLVFGGYYLIATGRASDETVDKVHHYLKTELDRMIGEFPLGEDLDTYMEQLRYEARTVPESHEMLRIVTTALDLRRVWFSKETPTRQDKVLAIDATFHMMHERGRYIMMFFVLYEGPLDYALEATLEALAHDTRRH